MLQFLFLLLLTDYAYSKKQACDPGKTWTKDSIKYECYQEGPDTRIRPLGCINELGDLVKIGQIFKGKHFVYECASNHIKKDVVYNITKCRTPDRNPVDIHESVMENGFRYTCEKKGDNVTLAYKAETQCHYKGKIYKIGDKFPDGKELMLQCFQSRWGPKVKAAFCVTKDGTEVGVGKVTTINDLYYKCVQKNVDAISASLKQTAVQCRTSNGDVKKLNEEWTENGLLYKCELRGLSTLIRKKGCVFSTAIDKNSTIKLNGVRQQKLSKKYYHCKKSEKTWFVVEVPPEKTQCSAGDANSSMPLFKTWNVKNAVFKCVWVDGKATAKSYGCVTDDGTSMNDEEIIEISSDLRTAIQCVMGNNNNFELRTLTAEEYTAWKAKTSGSITGSGGKGTGHGTEQETTLKPNSGSETGENLQKCQTPMDVIFVVDESKSIGKQNFTLVKRFVSHLVDAFEIGPDKVQIGTMRYSGKKHRFHVVHQLNTYHNAQQIKKTIASMPYSAGDRATGRALLNVQKIMLREKAGLRRNAKKVIIVITDGNTNQGIDPKRPADWLRAIGSTVYAVGMTDSIDMNELEDIAGSPQNVFTADTFMELSKLVAPQVTLAVCEDADEVVETTRFEINSTTTAKFSSCNAKMDIIFVVDESKSIGRENYTKVKRFVSDLIGGFHVDSGRVRVGTIKYSGILYYGIDIVHYLNTYSSKIAIQEAIETMSYARGRTATGKALRTVRNELLVKDKGMRADSVKIVIVITDGNYNEGEDPKFPAQDLTAAGVTIYAIGVTDNVHYKQLKRIAGKSRNIFKADCFRNLTKAFENELFNAICRDAVDAIQPPVMINNKCDLTLDLVIVIDKSNSMGDDSFELVKQFALKLVEGFDIDSGAVQVGTVPYSAKRRRGIRVTYLFHLFGTLRVVQAAIKGLNTGRQIGQPKTGKALKVVTNSVLNYENGMREKSMKVVLIITDGNYNKRNSPKKHTEVLRDAGVEVYVLGIGNGSEYKELRQIAGRERNIFAVPTFDQLSEIRNLTVASEIKNAICQDGTNAIAITEEPKQSSFDTGPTPTESSNPEESSRMHLKTTNIAGNTEITHEQGPTGNPWKSENPKETDHTGGSKVDHTGSPRLSENLITLPPEFHTRKSEDHTRWPESHDHSRRFERRTEWPGHTGRSEVPDHSERPVGRTEWFELSSHSGKSEVPVYTKKSEAPDYTRNPAASGGAPGTTTSFLPPDVFYNCSDDYPEPPPNCRYVKLAGAGKSCRYKLLCNCSEYEKFKKCGSSCEPICGIGNFKGLCIESCQPGCYCKNNFIRAVNGECIHKQLCQKKEIIAQCPMRKEPLADIDCKQTTCPNSSYTCIESKGICCLDDQEEVTEIDKVPKLVIEMSCQSRGPVKIGTSLDKLCRSITINNVGKDDLNASEFIVPQLAVISLQPILNVGNEPTGFDMETQFLASCRPLTSKTCILKNGIIDLSKGLEQNMQLKIDLKNIKVECNSIYSPNFKDGNLSLVVTADPFYMVPRNSCISSSFALEVDEIHKLNHNNQGYHAVPDLTNGGYGGFIVESGSGNHGAQFIRVDRSFDQVTYERVHDLSQEILIVKQMLLERYFHSKVQKSGGQCPAHNGTLPFVSKSRHMKSLPAALIETLKTANVSVDEQHEVIVNFTMFLHRLSFCMNNPGFAAAVANMSCIYKKLLHSFYAFEVVKSNRDRNHKKHVLKMIKKLKRFGVHHGSSQNAAQKYHGNDNQHVSFKKVKQCSQYLASKAFYEYIMKIKEYAPLQYASKIEKEKQYRKRMLKSILRKLRVRAEENDQTDDDLIFGVDNDDHDDDHFDDGNKGGYGKQWKRKHPKTKEEFKKSKKHGKKNWKRTEKKIQCTQYMFDGLKELLVSEEKENKCDTEFPLFFWTVDKDAVYQGLQIDGNKIYWEKRALFACKNQCFPKYSSRISFHKNNKWGNYAGRKISAAKNFWRNNRNKFGRKWNKNNPKWKKLRRNISELIEKINNQNTNISHGWKRIEEGGKDGWKLRRNNHSKNISDDRKNRGGFHVKINKTTEMLGKLDQMDIISEHEYKRLKKQIERLRAKGRHLSKKQAKNVEEWLVARFKQKLKKRLANSSNMENGTNQTSEIMNFFEVYGQKNQGSGVGGKKPQSPPNTTGIDPRTSKLIQELIRARLQGLVDTDGRQVPRKKKTKRQKQK